MTDLRTDARGGRPPALGVSYEGRPRELLAAVAPLVDVVEVLPDCLVGRDGRPQRALLDDLDELAPDVGLTLHGIGLSIGTTTGWNEDYLRLLDTMFAWREPRWHSEHLGFTTVDGSFLGTMPALPPTPEALELVVARSRSMSAAYGREFLLEHVATPLARPGQMSLATFLNTLATETGNRLLVDLHNLECDADNGLLDLDDFVEELDWSLVGELHLAGGVWYDGRHLDVHSGPVADSTLDLLDVALARATNLDLVLYEVLGEAVPGLGIDTVVDQVTTLRQRVAP
jgi:uncharacterized protein